MVRSRGRNVMMMMGGGVIMMMMIMIDSEVVMMMGSGVVMMMGRGVVMMMGRGVVIMGRVVMMMGSGVAMMVIIFVHPYHLSNAAQYRLCNLKSSCLMFLYLSYIDLVIMFSSFNWEGLKTLKIIIILY